MKWTKADEKYLEDNYRNMTAKEIASNLNRSVASVANKASVLCRDSDKIRRNFKLMKCECGNDFKIKLKTNRSGTPKGFRKRNQVTCSDGCRDKRKKDMKSLYYMQGRGL